MSQEHEWSKITLSDGRVVWMSRDAVRLDGVRVNVTYDEALALASALEGRLPTPEELDARWSAAQIRNKPHTQKLWLVKASGKPAARENDDGAIHSQAIDDDIAASSSSSGCIVGNVGKHWVQTPDDASVRYLYGWHVDTTYKTWKGIPVHPSESGETEAKIIQRSTDTSHGSNHVDYSMTCVVSRDTAPDSDDDIYDEDTPQEPAPVVDGVVAELELEVGTPSIVEAVITKVGDVDPGTKGNRRGPVTNWQKQMSSDGYSVEVDGWHGDGTEEMTLRWLADRGLARPEAIQREEVPPTLPAPTSGAGGSAPGGSLASIVDEQVPARNHGPKRELDSVIWIVLHSIEGYAGATARWFSGESAPTASAHLIIGPDRVYQGLPLDVVGWAAPGANRAGVQIEQEGWALKTDWLRAGAGRLDGLRVLELSARTCAAVADELSIPATKLTPELLLDGAPGFCTHDMVRQAIALAKKKNHKAAPWWDERRGRYKHTDHVDPGGRNDARWPWERYLELVRSHQQ